LSVSLLAGEVLLAAKAEAVASTSVRAKGPLEVAHTKYNLAAEP
jgi:hypothetical protein